MSIVFLATFERQVYELKKPTAEKILKIAKAVYKETFDQSEDSLRALNTPHIYSWESACSYHGYGLAEVALHQWREYFHQKYGYIVDNPQVGKEMIAAWSWGSLYDFKTSVKLVTGKKLSAKALIKHITRTPNGAIADSKKRMAARAVAKTKAAKLNATIELVHGKKQIANSEHGVAEMGEMYKKWYQRLR